MTSTAGSAADGGESGASTSGGADSPGAEEGGAGGQNLSGAATGGAAGSVSGGGGGGGGGVPNTEETLGCAKWIVEQADTLPVQVTSSDDGLVLVYPAGTSSFAAAFGDFSLVQEGLSGDFDITVSWKDFVPGDVKPFLGPRFEAGIFWHEPSGSVYSGTSRVGGGTAEAAVIHGEQFTLNSLSPVEAPAWYEGAAGSFRFQRSSDLLTVTTTVNGKSVTAMSEEPFPEEPLQLALWFDSDTRSTKSTKPSGVTITGVEVTGGGGSVKSDDFSCP